MVMLNWSQRIRDKVFTPSSIRRSLVSAALCKTAVFKEWKFPKSYFQAALPAVRGISYLVLKRDLDDTSQHPLQKDWTLYL